MISVRDLLVEMVDVWTEAKVEQKNSRGRSSNDRKTFYGLKRLKDLILELAINGRLLNQIDDDKTLVAYLSECTKRADNFFLEEHSGTLPKGWGWVRFGDVLDFQGGSQPPKNKFSNTKLDGYVQLLQIRDLGENPQPVFIDKKLTTKFCSSADIMIGRYGASVGKIFWGKDGAYNVALVKVIDKYDIFDKKFLYQFLNSPLGQSLFSGISRSAQAGFNKGDIENKLIPVCTMRDQKRVAAKVEELMQLCSELEDRTAKASDTHENLVETLLALIVNARNKIEIGSAWKKIENTFDELFSTESSINFLKLSLLKLAIQGRLTYQNQDDEPATKLLEQIAVKKSQLISKGLIKKEKPMRPISEGEKGFSLPGGWEWVRLQAVIDVRDGTHDSPKESVDSNSYPLITSKDFNNGEINFSGAKRISAEDHAEISKRSFVEKYDILFSMIGGNIGNQVMVYTNEQFSIKNVALFKYYDKELTYPPFIKKYTEYLADTLQDSAVGGAQPFVSLGQLRSLVMALPPKQEQRRIVEKLDELLTICEKLREKLIESNRLRQELADALVNDALI